MEKEKLKVRMLEAVAGTRFSYRRNEVVELDAELAQKWNGSSCVILPPEIETTEGRGAIENTAKRVTKKR